MKCAKPDCNNDVEFSKRTNLPKLYCSRKCCGQHNSAKSRDKARQTFLDKYGVDNPQKNVDIKQKTIETLKEKYDGAINPSQLADWREKCKNTSLKNYGAEHHNQSDIGKQQRKNTCLEKYGVENPFQIEFVKENMRNDYLEKYGFEYPGQVPAIKEKMKQTHLAVRGVENPSQDPTVQRKILKSGLSTKEYKMPSGKTVMIQGYENFALDYYLTLYSEDDIVVGDPELIPVIDYLDENEHPRKYFPDMFIPKDNLIIETKSTYTYTKQLERNLRKKAVAEKLGYTFIFFIK